MLHARLLALLALAAAVALAGCTTQRSASHSTSQFRGEQKSVADVAARLQTAAAKGDQVQICRGLLAPALVTQLAQDGGTCERAVRAALKDTDLTDFTIQAVAIQGSRATARVRFPIGKSDRRQSLSLVRQGSAWRIAGFG